MLESLTREDHYCTRCHGFGYLLEWPNGLDIPSQAEIVDCTACQGQGWIRGPQCTVCGYAGQITMQTGPCCPDSDVQSGQTLHFQQELPPAPPAPR